MASAWQSNQLKNRKEIHGRTCHLSPSRYPLPCLLSPGLSLSLSLSRGGIPGGGGAGRHSRQPGSWEASASLSSSASAARVTPRPVVVQRRVRPMLASAIEILSSPLLELCRPQPPPPSRSSSLPLELHRPIAVPHRDPLVVAAHNRLCRRARPPRLSTLRRSAAVVASAPTLARRLLGSPSSVASLLIERDGGEGMEKREEVMRGRREDERLTGRAHQFKRNCRPDYYVRSKLLWIESVG